MTTRRRTRRAFLGAVLAALSAAALVVALRPAAPGPDQGQPATQARVQFEKTAAPQRGVASSLITPAGADWWAAVDGLHGALGLPDTPPPRARWYAATTSRVYQPADDRFVLFHAVYVAFPTAAAADRYQPTRGPQACTCGRFTRGNVVTLTSVWADGYDEAYRTLPNGADIRPPRAGSWSVDLTQRIALLTERNPHGDALGEFFTRIGFGGADVSWSGTAEAARGPWVGDLRGWAADDVDVDSASAALAATIELVCDETGKVCDVIDDGVAGLDAATYAEDRHTAWGTDALAPALEGIATDRLQLIGGYDPDTWEGLAAGTTRASHTRLEKVTYLIDDTDTMTVHLHLSSP